MSEKSSLVRHPSTLRSISTPAEEEVFRLLAELWDLFIQYKREVPGQRRPWPESIRERISRLWSLGVTCHQISSESGVPVQTLYSWRQRIKKQKSERGFTQIPIARSRRRTNFQIQQDESRHSSNHQLSQLESLTTTPVQPALVITLSNGVKIEGLCFEQVQILVRVMEV